MTISGGALWDRGGTPTCSSTAQMPANTGIEVVFPVVHTPYYVY